MDSEEEAKGADMIEGVVIPAPQGQTICIYYSTMPLVLIKPADY
jgi:hypothetical protein